MEETSKHLIPDVKKLLDLDKTGRSHILFDKFSEFGYLDAPASAYYHYCFAGGLLLHCFNVAQTALKMADMGKMDVDRGSVVLCSLFHDAEKLGAISWNLQEKKWEHVPRYKVNDKFDNTQPISKKNAPFHYNLTLDVKRDSLSGYYCGLFVPMTIEEYVAIATHDSIWVPGNRSDFMHDKGNLAILVEMADRWSGDILEKDNPHLNLTRK